MKYAITLLRTLVFQRKAQTLSMSSAVHENVKVSGDNGLLHHVYTANDDDDAILIHLIPYTYDSFTSGLMRVDDVFLHSCAP